MRVFGPVHLLPTHEEIPRIGVPVEYLRQVLAYAADTSPVMAYFGDAQRKREDYYLTGLAALAGTYEDMDEAVDLFAKWCAWLPTGECTATARPGEVRRYTLALHGLARDRELHGRAARSLEVWLVAADEALATYRRPLPAAGLSGQVAMPSAKPLR